MPQKFTTTYDRTWASLDVFNPANLTTGEDIRRAVNTLQDSLDSQSIGSIIQCSFRHTHNRALEFMLSCTSRSASVLFYLCQLPTNARLQRLAMPTPPLSQRFYWTISHQTLKDILTPSVITSFQDCRIPSRIFLSLLLESRMGWMTIFDMERWQSLPSTNSVSFYKAMTSLERILWQRRTREPHQEPHRSPVNQSPPSPPTWKASNASKLWDTSFPGRVTLPRTRRKRL
jgi:hypothetical protein